MYRQGKTLFLLTVICFSLPCFANHLAVVAPKDNTTDAITSAELAKVVKSETLNWPDGNGVVVVINGNSAVTLQLLEHLLKLSEAEVKALIAAHPATWVKADSDASLLAIVESRRGAVGIVDVHSINDSQVHVLKVDGKLPMELGYLPH